MRYQNNYLPLLCSQTDIQLNIQPMEIFNYYTITKKYGKVRYNLVEQLGYHIEVEYKVDFDDNDNLIIKFDSFQIGKPVELNEYMKSQVMALLERVENDEVKLDIDYSYYTKLSA